MSKRVPSPVRHAATNPGPAIAGGVQALRQHTIALVAAPLALVVGTVLLGVTWPLSTSWPEILAGDIRSSAGAFWGSGGGWLLAALAALSIAAHGVLYRAAHLRFTARDFGLPDALAPINWLGVAVVWLGTTALGVLGFAACILPLFAVVLVTQYALAAVVTGGENPLRAFATSVSIVRAAPVTSVTLAFFHLIIIIVGIATLGLGWVAGMPVVATARTYVYRNMLGKSVSAPRKT